jgi:hypothetical protein
MLKSLGHADLFRIQDEGAAMSIGHGLPFLPSGLLRVRAANQEFQQLIRNADIILAADVRNPRNTWVVFLDPRLQDDDCQNERTAEILTVPVDYESDDAEIPGELCKMLKGPAAVIDEPGSISKGLRNPESVLVSS